MTSYSIALFLHVLMRSALTVGIVFLMTVKPTLSDSLTAIAVAAIIGAISAMPVRFARSQA